MRVWGLREGLAEEEGDVGVVPEGREGARVRGCGEGWRRRVSV